MREQRDAQKDEEVRFCMPREKKRKDYSLEKRERKGGVEEKVYHLAALGEGGKKFKTSRQENQSFGP